MLSLQDRIATLGANTFGFYWQCTAADAVRQLAGEGFSCFDIISAPPHFDLFQSPREEVSVLKRALRETDSRVSAINIPSMDQNLASPCAGMREYTLQLHRRAFDLARELDGARVVIIGGKKHPLAPGSKDRLLELYTSLVDQIVEHADAAGISLVLENHPLGLLPDHLSILSFIERYEGRIGVLYDVANGLAVKEDPVVAIRTIGGSLSMIHLSDNRHGEWRHDPIGDGEVDFRAVLEAAQDQSFEGEMLLEIMGDNPLGGFARARDTLQARL